MAYTPGKFIIVEESGMRNERQLSLEFRSYTEANDYMKATYDPDEIEDMHVDIALIDADGLPTYDF